MAVVVSLVGLADKRPLIYGLCHCFAKLGKVIVITANEGFLGASDYKEHNFMISDVQFIVTTREGEEAFESAAWYPFEYDYVIHDCTLSIPPKTDFIVHVGSQNKRMWLLEREMIEVFPDLPRETICLGGGKYMPIKAVEPEAETPETVRVQYKKSILPFVKPKKVQTSGVVAVDDKATEQLKHLKFTSSMWGYVNELEDTQQFPPVSDPALCEVVAHLGGRIAKLDPKLLRKQMQGGKI